MYLKMKEISRRAVVLTVAQALHLIFAFRYDLAIKILDMLSPSVLIGPTSKEKNYYE
jgi:hypothetical protein